MVRLYRVREQPNRLSDHMAVARRERRSLKRKAVLASKKEKHTLALVRAVPPASTSTNSRKFSGYDCKWESWYKTARLCGLDVDAVVSCEYHRWAECPARSR